jgi:hypothetical protein
MVSALTKPWNWRCITLWDGYLSQSQPTDSAREADNKR